MKFGTKLLWPEGLKPTPVERVGRGYNPIFRLGKRVISTILGISRIYYPEIME